MPDQNPPQDKNHTILSLDDVHLMLIEHTGPDGNSRFRARIARQPPLDGSTTDVLSLTDLAAVKVLIDSALQLGLAAHSRKL